MSEHPLDKLSKQSAQYIKQTQKHNSVTIPNKQSLSDVDKIRWQLRCKFIEIYHENNHLIIDHEIIDIRSEYLSECLDILLKIYIKNNSVSQLSCPQIDQQISQWLIVMQKTDKLFFQKYIAIKIQFGENTNQIFSHCWKTFLYYLWNQLISPKNQPIIARTFFTCNLQNLQQIINKIFLDIKFTKILQIQQQNQSPMFSEDSFDPNLFREKKIIKKYNKYTLEDFLGHQAVGKMRDRLLEIRDDNRSKRLIKNLQQVFEGQKIAKIIIIEDDL